MNLKYPYRLESTFTEVGCQIPGSLLYCCKLWLFVFSNLHISVSLISMGTYLAGFDVPFSQCGTTHMQL